MGVPDDKRHIDRLSSGDTNVTRGRFLSYQDLIGADDIAGEYSDNVQTALWTGDSDAVGCEVLRLAVVNIGLD